MLRQEMRREDLPRSSPIIAFCDRRLGVDAVTAVALSLTIAGWSLVWARALSLVEFLPMPVAVGCLALGVALIPFRPKRVSCIAVIAASAWLLGAGAGQAQSPPNCPATHDQLVQALKASIKASGGPSNGGFDNHEWAAVVNRDGTICAVAFSGQKATDQWPASRAIAMEKANTANGVSLDTMALSTANLYAGALPGGPLYGLTASNPAISSDLYTGDPKSYGSDGDPLVGKRVGGGVAFGGGLALYNGQGVVGGLGVSGDTSCADHNVAWRVRQGLGLDKVPNGVSPDHNDAIIYDMLPDKTSASGYGHAQCGGREADVAQEIHSGVVPKWAQVMVK